MCPDSIRKILLLVNCLDKKITSTPLLEYLASKKQERREERRKKLDEKKKQRDDDKRGKKDGKIGSPAGSSPDDVSFIYF